MDVGVTSAFAALDLDGEPIAVESKRNWSQKNFVEALRELNPIIIACDTNPPQKQARKLATIFSAKLFYPKYSLSLEEKMVMTRRFTAKNRHERDALAAARKAFHAFENKLRQLKKHLEKAQRVGERVQATTRVLHGMRIAEYLSH